MSERDLNPHTSDLRRSAAALSSLVDRANPALLAYVLHLPPSAVSLVSDVRFRSSAQRLARLTS
jgi:hypothetical protein